MNTRLICTNHSLWSIAALATALLLTQSLALEAGNWQPGDVFAGIAGGCYNVFDNNGNFLEQVCDGSQGFTTGCAFDQAGQGNLYTTSFSTNQIVVYDMNHPHNILCSFATPGDPNFTPGAPSLQNESVVFDAAGNLFVGHPDGDHDMHLYDVSTSCPPPGLPVPLVSFDVNIQAGGRGTDWIDLAQNQQDMFYTSERDQIRIWDVVANAQGAPDPFATVGSNNFALRLLGPACDGFTDGLIVAELSQIRQLDGAGIEIECYDAPGENNWFSFNVDPDGIHFWAGDFGSNNFYKFLINVDGGGCNPPVLGPIASGGALFGLCVKGEVPCGVCEVVEDPNVQTQGFWKRQCAAPHPSGEHANLPDYVDSVDDAATFAGVGSVGELCDRLHPNPEADKCEQAEAQFMALQLNLASGRVATCNCIDDPDLGQSTVGEAADFIDGLLSNPGRTFQDCVLAQAIADRINNGLTLVACP